MTLEKFNDTIEIVEKNIDTIIDEIILFQQTQTSLLRNDHYLVKDKDTQAVFESVLKKYQKKSAPNNHLKSYDLKHSGAKISIKSGQVKNGNLKFSYSRTTEFNTLDKKINYLATFDNLILGLASEKINIKESKKNIISKTKYHLYYLPANFIDIKNLEWLETENMWQGKNKINNVNVDIVKKMSDQPWISIPTLIIPCRAILTATVGSHNNRKYLIIDRMDTNQRIYFDLYTQRKKIRDLKGIEKCSPYTLKNAIN